MTLQSQKLVDPTLARDVSGEIDTILSALSPDELLCNQIPTCASDLTSAHDSVKEVFFSHNLSLQRPADTVSFYHKTRALNALSFNIIGYGADIMVSVDDIDREKYVLVIPLSGVAEVRHGGDFMSVDRGSYIILDPHQAFDFTMTPEHTHLAIGMPKSLVGNAARNYIDAPVHSVTPFSHQIQPISSDHLAFLDFIGFLCREMDRPPSNIYAPGVSDALSLSFLHLLFSCIHSGDSTSKNAGALSTSAIAVRRAEAFIVDNVKEQIASADIAHNAGVAVRTLAEQFRRCRNTSPMKWLKLQRLHCARTDLLNPFNAQSVTEIALKYWFENCGRFAKSYYNEFGEYPSYTRNQSRIVTTAPNTALLQ